MPTNRPKAGGARPEPLFKPPPEQQPLAARMRPRSLAEFEGQEHLQMQSWSRRDRAEAILAAVAGRRYRIREPRFRGPIEDLDFELRGFRE
jgi:hypothetical protein